MSSNHHAVFSTASGPREASVSEYVRALAAHGLIFSGSARGLAFEAEWDDFEPVLGQELEGLVDWHDAIEHSRGWPCVSVDARMRFWDVEIYLFDADVDRQSHGLAMYLPNAWYDALGANQLVSNAWRRLTEALLNAGGHDGFICGTAVPLRPWSVEEIVAALEKMVDESKEHPSTVHSAALLADRLGGQLQARLQAAGFVVLPSSGRFAWITRSKE